MPKLSDLMNSRFIKKDDINPKGTLVTINYLERQNVAPEDATKEYKWVIFFDEFAEKGMVLNPTNATMLSEILGSDDTDHWIGQAVVAYIDPTIMMGTKRVGGIRFRGREAPKTEEAPRRPAPPRQEEYDEPAPRRPAPQRQARPHPDDDVPF
jgi:hypothetical protein